MTLYVRAGDGGSGCASFRREKFVPKGGPDGGDGGRGGHVVLKGNRDETSLVRLYFTPHQRTENGGPGRGKQQHGRNGADLFVSVPRGTEVWDKGSGELLGDIVEHGQELLVARGGKGGLGNCHWKSATHQAPREHTDGEPGEEGVLALELKLMADIGLVGFPNAGKSSLLAAVSHAHPKIDAYPFTTLNPIIGTLVFDDYSRLTLADIPGLLKGAHRGVGLGHEFLRHVERARFLVLVIDMAAVDGRNPVEDYDNLREELRLHRRDLVDRPCLTVANKMDLPEAARNFAPFVRETGVTPLRVSARERIGLEALKKGIAELAGASGQT